MADQPEYRVYRSRPGFLKRLFYREKDADRFERPQTLDRPAERLRPRREPRERPGLLEPELPDWRKRITPKRVLIALGGAIGFWIVLSFVLFMISAHIQSNKEPAAFKRALDNGGNLLTSANNI